MVECSARANVYSASGCPSFGPLKCNLSSQLSWTGAVTRMWACTLIKISLHRTCCLPLPSCLCAPGAPSNNDSPASDIQYRSIQVSQTPHFARDTKSHNGVSGLGPIFQRAMMEKKDLELRAEEVEVGWVGKVVVYLTCIKEQKTTKYSGSVCSAKRNTYFSLLYVRAS